jgi:uncharacterized protein YabE (DUF348 family)
MNSQAKSMKRLAAVALFAAVCAGAQQGKNKADITGKYEGTAKNAAGEVITVTLDLMEKNGALRDDQLVARRFSHHQRLSPRKQSDAPI